MLVQDEAQQCIAGITRTLSDAVTDIRSVKTGDEPLCLGQVEALNDLIACWFIGGRGQRDAWNLRKAFVQDRKLYVLRTKIMSPL